jgi:uncharacterized protein YijF (DUF1287 family)
MRNCCGNLPGRSQLLHANAICRDRIETSGVYNLYMRMTWAWSVLAVLGCASPSAEATPSELPKSPEVGDRVKAALASPVASLEATLGVADTGIFPDLDGRTQIVLPDGLPTELLRAEHHTELGLLILFEGDWPLKIYPVDGSERLQVGDTTLKLRPGDAGELAPLLGSKKIQVVGKAKRDRDGDGIPDSLDVLVGAIKTVHNGANYGGGYRRIDYPGGDIPREDGVCTDVVIRAVRNAGLDIQAALQQDIKRSPKSFPMVKKRNPNIDHRRVKTLLPYFKRQWQAHTITLKDSDDPLRPGDIVFMDTFPKRSGPDHIGILSNQRGTSGHLLVINNWTNGFKTSEMDLLRFVPITHRFRLP